MTKWIFEYRVLGNLGSDEEYFTVEYRYTCRDLLGFLPWKSDIWYEDMPYNKFCFYDKEDAIKWATNKKAQRQASFDEDYLKQKKREAYLKDNPPIII